MYYIYKIAYQIDDEIKKRKENEKPFYWEHIHPEIKDKTLEEVEKYLTDGGLDPEKLKEMTKNEKYLAVSEGLYDAELKEKTTQLALAEESSAAKTQTSFLDTEPKPGDPNPGEGVSSLKPTDIGDDPSRKKPDLPSILDEPVPGANPLNEPVKKVTLPGESTGATTVPTQTNTTIPVNGGKMDSMKVKRESQTIMRKMAEEINKNNNRTPEETEALIDSILSELQTAKNSIYVD